MQDIYTQYDVGTKLQYHSIHSIQLLLLPTFVSLLFDFKYCEINGETCEFCFYDVLLLRYVQIIKKNTLPSPFSSLF